MGGSNGAHIPEAELTLFWMLLAVVAVGLVTKRIRLPYTVALVIAGLIIAIIPNTPVIELTPELIVAVFLPTLIFEAAYNLNFNHLRENLRPITFLAIPGVLITATVVATAVHLIGGLAWPIAFLFGAIVSATDPVSVVAIFKALGAPERLRTILEGESLFNDGTAIVLFNLILGIIVVGNFNPLTSMAQFGIVVVGGLLIGAVVGYVGSFLLAQVDDYLIETALTLAVAYGTFFLAEELGVSGVIAVVAAGLIVGNYGQRVAFSPSSRIAVGTAWELFGFIANSLIFLLVGLQLRTAQIETAVGLIVLAIVAVLVSRGLVVGLTGWLLRVLRIDHPIPHRWQLVLIWGGLRGALSLALALSIPATVGDEGAQRETLLAMTFGVILFSLLVQGLTMQPLLVRLKIAGRGEELVRHQRLRAELSIVQAALLSLEARAKRGEVEPSVREELRGEYEQRKEKLRMDLESLHIENSTLREVDLIDQRRIMLQVEKSTLRDLFGRGAIDEETMRELEASIDRRLQDDEEEEAETFEEEERQVIAAEQR